MASVVEKVERIGNDERQSINLGFAERAEGNNEIFLPIRNL